MKNALLSLGGLCALMLLSCSRPSSEPQTLWTLGVRDTSTADLALGPDGYRQFLANDFGFEDK